MKKGKFTLLALPIYNIDLAISVGQTYNELKKSIYSVWDIPEEDFPESDLADFQTASVMCRHSGDFYVPYCFRFKTNPLKGDKYDALATISHECFHATYRILHSRGLELCYESEEAFCYLQGHLTREVFKFLLCV